MGKWIFAFIIIVIIVLAIIFWQTGLFGRLAFESGAEDVITLQTVFSRFRR